MSSEELVASIKDLGENDTVDSHVQHDFTISSLALALKTCHTLVPANLSHDLSESNSAVATEADWDKFWAAVDKVNAPLTALVEPYDSDQLPVTVSTSNNLPSRGEATDAVYRAADIARKTTNRPRDEWTQHVVSSSFRENNSRFNFIIVRRNTRTEHNWHFAGQRGQDWQLEYVTYGFNQNFTIFALRSGTFTMLGDGGFINWAYYGNVVSDTGGNARPRIVIFQAPSFR